MDTAYAREWARVSGLRERLTALETLLQAHQKAARERLAANQNALQDAWREAVLCLNDGLEALPLGRTQRERAAAELCFRAARLVACGQTDMTAMHDAHAPLAGVRPLMQQRAERRAEHQAEWSQAHEAWSAYRAETDARRAKRDARRAARARNQATPPHPAVPDPDVDAQVELRALYRRLASALHPDREPDPTLRQHKTRLMTEANTAYDRRDWPGLLAIEQQALLTETSAPCQPAPERLAALTALLRQRAATLERERQAAQRRWRHALGLPDALALESDALARWLDRQDVLLQAELALAQQDAQDLNDARRFKSWLNKRLQSPNGPPPPGTGA